MHIELCTPPGTTLRVAYDALEIFPFTSESNRMGIVVHDTVSGEFSFLQKDADVVVARIMEGNDWLEEEMANMARECLRTPVAGHRKLSEATYDNVY
jgi:phospholipid-translocating ATPase